MDIRLDALIRSTGGKYRLINAVLAVAASVSAAAFLYALWRPVYVREPGPRKTIKTVQREPVRAAEPRASYNVIVEKDLFRQARQRYAPPPKPSPRPAALPPPPPKPPPKLALIGTVLRAEGEEAILDYQAGGQKSAYYRVGDSIEGFVITEIRKDYVLLVRDKETMRVGMRQGTQGPQPAQPLQQAQPVQLSQPAQNQAEVNPVPPRLRNHATVPLPPASPL